MSLNAAHRLVAKAFQERDDDALAFLVALPLAETLLRRRREPFVAAALGRIRSTLLPEEERATSVWLVLSELLAGVPQLRAVTAELTGEGSTGPRLIFDVRLDASAEPEG